MTGMREKPERSASDRPWRSVLSCSIHTISVRGTITSLTMVSPSSKTEWIMRRSPASIRSDSSHRSTCSRSSASEVNGPSVKPRPGVMALPMMMRICGIGPITVVNPEIRPVLRSAMRSAFCRPSVRAATPTRTKETINIGTMVKVSRSHRASKRPKTTMPTCTMAAISNSMRRNSAVFR